MVLKLTLIVLLAYPQIGDFYTAYRVINNNCGYYDNPAFGLNPPAVLIHNRFNHIPKEPKDEISKTNIGEFKLGYYLTQAHDLLQSEEEPEEKSEEAQIDPDQFWKIGEVPPINSVKLVTLPDVYVAGDEEYHPFVIDDAAPISDIMSVEKSEMTAEAHDMGDVEIDEKYLHDIGTKPQEIFVEKITEPEIPGFKFFNSKPANIGKNKMDREKEMYQRVKEKSPVREGVIMKIKKKKPVENESFAKNETNEEIMNKTIESKTKEQNEEIVTEEMKIEELTPETKPITDDTEKILTETSTLELPTGTTPTPTGVEAEKKSPIAS